LTIRQNLGVSSTLSFSSGPIWQIALFTGMDRILDYAPPAGWDGPAPLNRRVRIPLGKRSVVGWVAGTAMHSTLAPISCAPVRWSWIPIRSWTRQA